MRPHTLTALDAAANELRDIPFARVVLVLGNPATSTPDEESFVVFCSANKAKKVVLNKYEKENGSGPYEIISVRWTIGRCAVNVQCSRPLTDAPETTDAE